ncbi:S1C family serine protease [Agrococcus lahaulensis]|uniref:S1C family serine protease n=1 Tax=Agrococcus lahaulensis TaxID=341722 RepID=UPI0006889317|nr:trypsin-like peptidase domain-containing protein [Agrococcus lahaulensis]
MDWRGIVEGMTNPYEPTQPASEPGRVPNPWSRPVDDARWQSARQPSAGQPSAQAAPPSAPYGTGNPYASAPFASSASVPSPYGQPHDGQPSYGPPAGTGTAQAPARRRGAGLVVGAIVGAALIGGATGFGGGALAAQQSSPQTQSAPAGGAAAEPVSDPGTIADVAAAAGPSVVTVQAASRAGAGEGSGVVIAPGGYIVTNNHVVTLDGQSADASITVETSDGRLLAAEIVGTDPVVDLAVLRVDAELPVVTFASSDDVRVGDTAIAIGAPLGLSNSVTDGIVSAVDRGLRIASSAAPDDSQDSQQSPFGFWQENGAQAAQEDISIPVVQTDASINPGNSGGALLNASGQLIGVNVAIASMGQGESSGSIGIGFAIESSLVQRVVQEIIDSGEATHGLLGATVSDVRDASIGSVGGQLRELTDGGAAAAAGLQPGDVITAIEGAPVTNAVDATAQVRAHAAGTTVTIEYLRDGERAEVEVTLGELP